MKKRGARLGQHFLTGLWAARALARAAGIAPGDTVLEIGPGKGALTKELLALGASVVAVEKDTALVAALEEIFHADIARGALRIVARDVRESDPESLGLKNGEFILAANIPYYITGEILRMFLTARAEPRTMALLVQKEVAERIVARDGKESILSLSVKAYGTPRIAAKVSRGNFSPPPSVDSAILVVTGISQKFFTQLDEKRFFDIVRAGFSSKRKLLAGNLRTYADKKTVVEVFQACSIEPNARAEDVPLETWKRLAQKL